MRPMSDLTATRIGPERVAEPPLGIRKRFRRVAPTQANRHATRRRGRARLLGAEPAAGALRARIDRARLSVRPGPGPAGEDVPPVPAPRRHVPTSTSCSGTRGLDAIVLATPVCTHAELAEACLRAGKHTFVEKPLAASSAEAYELARLASERDLVLMCGHTFTYSPPVRAVKKLIDDGELGDLYFISSSRVNLGLHQRDVSVLWDLGPHDFSILRYWLDATPETISACGRDAVVRGIPDVAFLTMQYASGLLGNIELSWLAPSKLRRTVLVGSKKMVVYEDGGPEPVRVFDHGVVYEDPETFGEYHLSYRTGDIVSPRVEGSEPLSLEIDDFISAVNDGRPLTAQLDLALDVVEMIEAAEVSLQDHGGPVALAPSSRRPGGVSRVRARGRVAASGGYGSLAADHVPSGTQERPMVASTYRPRDYLLRRALAAADLVGVVCATAAALAILPVQDGWPRAALLAPTLPAWLVLFRAYGLYERDVKRISLSVLDDLPALFHAFVIGTLALWLYIDLLGYEPGPGLPGAAVFAAVGIASVSCARLVARRLFLRIKGPSRVLLVGGSAISAMLVRKMEDHPEYGLDPVGEVTIDARSDTPVPWLGRLADVDMTGLALNNRIDRVIVSAPEIDDESMMELMGDCGAAAAKVSILPGHIDALGPSLEVDDIEGLTMLGLNPLVLARTSRVLKRSLDLTGALLGLILLAPLLIAVAIAIRLESPGPVLFRQRRVGRRGHGFTLLKFRTMVVDAEARTEELRARSARSQLAQARGRSSRHSDRPDPAAGEHRRAAPALERIARGDEPGRAPAADRQ